MLSLNSDLNLILSGAPSFPCKAEHDPSREHPEGQPTGLQPPLGLNSPPHHPLKSCSLCTVNLREKTGFSPFGGISSRSVVTNLYDIVAASFK